MDLGRISKESQEKLAQLYGGGGVGRLFPDRGMQAEIISDLGRTGEITLLPELVNYVLHGNAVLRDAARRALTGIVVSIPHLRLPEVDVWMRERMSDYNLYDSGWSRMSPREVGKYGGPDQFGPLALAAMHANGRVREAALRALSVRSDGAELPFLLLRLNDWVNRIRDVARELVEARIRSEYAPHFMRYLSLALRIERCQRSKHAWLVESIARLLNENEAVLEGGLRSEDTGIRRACLRFAVAVHSTSAQKALNAALDDRDPMSRLWAAKQLIACSDAEGISSLHRKLCHDPLMPVRREALSALVERGADGIHEALLAALLDRHSSMRDLARFRLREVLDVAEFYRGAVRTSTGLALAAALRGLGECGSPADTDALVPFFGSPEVRIRKAAVAAAGRLAAEKMRHALIRALADDSPGVSAQACIALRGVAVSIVDELDDLKKDHPTPFVRRNALRLICDLSKWERLPRILAGTRDDSPEVAAMAVTSIRKWLAGYNGSYLSPTTAQLQVAEEELRKCREHISPQTVRELEEIIAWWRRH